jgi:hypothetical protein
MDLPRTGSKLACPTCGTQLIVVKAPTGVPACCGTPLQSPAGDRADRGQ